MNLKNNERWTHKKNIFSFISEINITKFEWLRVKSTLNDAAKRVPFHYNQDKDVSAWQPSVHSLVLQSCEKHAVFQFKFAIV